MITEVELIGPAIAPERPVARRESGGDTRVPELDGLRGLAIAMVVAFHYLYFVSVRGYQAQSLSARLYLYFERVVGLGWSGVDLFFVLSGFLIGGILLDARGSRSYFRTFYARRFYRIIPLYFAWIGAFVAGSYALRAFIPAHAADFGFGWGMLPAQFLFLQNIGFVSYGVLARSWLGQTWSLAVEEQFYLVSPIFVRALSRRALYAGLGLVVALAPLWRLWIRAHQLPFANDLGWAYTLMPSRADALCLGILVALLWKDDAAKAWCRSHRRILATASGVFALGIIPVAGASPGMWPAAHSSAMQSIGYSCFAFFYASILLLVLSHPAGVVGSFLRVTLLRKIGKVAYCLYLIHEMVGLAAQTLLRAVVPHAALWQSFLASLAAAVAAYGIANLSWRYFEQPLVVRGHAFKY